MSHQQPDRLFTTPGNFDYPPATYRPAPAAHSLVPLPDHDDVHVALGALRQSLQRERTRARYINQALDARRRRRALTPLSMPSGDGSPARRMRNILRHVRNQARDEQNDDETSRPEADQSSDVTTSAPATGVAAVESTQAVQAPSQTTRASRDVYASNFDFRDFESSRMLSHLQNHPPPLAPQPVHIGEPVESIPDAPVTRMTLHETSDRLAQVSEDLRSLLAQPLPSSELTRQRSEEDDGSESRGHKRRRLDATSPSKAYYPIKYGTQGQVVSGKLNMQLVSTDGGIVSPSAGEVRWNRSSLHDVHDKYAAANVLRDDASVYCTRSSHCNMVFQHQGQTAFTLEKLVIKAPKTGFTDPVQEGLVFTALHQDAIFEATKRYHIWHYDSSRFGHLFRPRQLTRTHAPLGRRMTQSTPPPSSHIRARRQSHTAIADDDWPESPLSEDAPSESPFVHTELPPGGVLLLQGVVGPDLGEHNDAEIDSNANPDLEELARRGNLAAAARHATEPSLRRALNAYATRDTGTDESSSFDPSRTWWDRARAFDASLIAMRESGRIPTFAEEMQAQVVPDVSLGFAAARRDLEEARAHLGELHRAITDGGDGDGEVGGAVGGAVGGNLGEEPAEDTHTPSFPPTIENPHATLAQQIQEMGARAAAAQRAADNAELLPDTPAATSAELLVPDARFTMHRHFSCGRHAPYERFTSYARSEGRIVPPTQPSDHDKFRPRSVEIVDERVKRPVQGLGSLLRSETGTRGERTDYVHVRTTQIVQKDNELTITFDPPVSAKVILLKLWNPKAGGSSEPDGKRNIDIQSIEAIGWAGPRWFPAVGLR